jgi:hypothetical protein
MDRIVGKWPFENSRKDSGDEWEIALDGKVMLGAWTAENDKVTLFAAVTSPRLRHERRSACPRRRGPGDTRPPTPAGRRPAR